MAPQTVEDNNHILAQQLPALLTDPSAYLYNLEYHYLAIHHQPRFEEIYKANRHYFRTHIQSQHPNRIVRPTIGEFLWERQFLLTVLKNMFTNKRYYIPRVEEDDQNIVLREKEYILPTYPIYSSQSNDQEYRKNVSTTGLNQERERYDDNDDDKVVQQFYNDYYDYTKHDYSIERTTTTQLTNNITCTKQPIAYYHHNNRFDQTDNKEQ